MSFLVVSVVLLWVVVLLLSVLVVLLYRQFGLLYIGSSGRVAMSGLDVGAHAPTDQTLRVDDTNRVLDWGAAGDGRGTLVIFGSPVCPLCEKLVPRLNEFAEGWAHVVDVWFVDRPLPGVDSPRRRLPDVMLWTYAVSEDGVLHDAFDVQVNPFAFTVNSDGRVLSKGLVNVPEDLVGLVTAATADQETSGDNLPEAAAEPIPVRSDIRIDGNPSLSRAAGSGEHHD